MSEDPRAYWKRIASEAKRIDLALRRGLSFEKSVALVGRRGPLPRPLAERLWSRVEKGPACWLWRGTVTSDGYGSIGAGGRCGRMLAAHRVAWELTVGPIPPGKSVLHRCDNPPCVNPDHLFLGTQRDNMRDCATKGRLGPQSSRPQQRPTLGSAK